MSKRHPEVAEPQPNRSMQNLNCHPELVSGSSHCDDEGSPLTPTLSRRARGKRAAFTLAEVLITLAIIGVVAAMTIPTLTQNYKKKIVETKLLKAYSIMNNAIKLSSIDNGPIETWTNFGISQNNTATYDDVLEWCNKYILPYMRVNQVKKSPDSEGILLYLADGSLLSIASHLYDVSYVINANDLNNLKSGVNHFMFRLGISIDYSSYTNPDLIKYVKEVKGFEPYVFAWDGTLDGAKYSTISPLYGCYQDYRALCAKLIQLNGWKIPKDYPYKF